MIDPMDVDDLGDLGNDDSSSNESHGKTVEADRDPIIENRVPRTSEASNERLQKVLEHWQSRTDKSSPTKDAEDAQWWREWIDNGQMKGSDVDIMKALYALSPRGQVNYFLISKNYMAELWLRGVTKEEFLRTMGVSKE